MRFVLDLPPLLIPQRAGAMSSPHPSERDLLQEDDPWQQTQPTAPGDASAAAPPFREDDDAVADASRAARIDAASYRGPSRAFATGTREAPPMRVIHDNPPSWSGDNPDKELEFCLKMLSGWCLPPARSKLSKA